MKVTLRLYNLDYIQGGGGGYIDKHYSIPYILKFFLYICTQVSDENGTPK